MKVLIVEDNADDRKLLHYTLVHHGCTVIEAQDGVDGLELAARHKPDLIVSDALMPRMDGFQFLRALKADSELSSIPFMFYSAVYTGETEEKLAFSLGAAAFVIKPTEPESFWKKICEIMESCQERQGAGICNAMDEREEYFLKEYGRIVATKLEEKIYELNESLALRKQAEEEMSTIFEKAPFVMLLLDGERRVRRANGMACTLAGSSIEEMLGRRSGDALRCLHSLASPEGCGFGPACRDCTLRISVLDTYETGQSHSQMEIKLPFSVQGKEQALSFLFSSTKVVVAHQSMVLLSIQDISEYKKLESQLHQAQKIESIGTLAGGIAHDFNNILTVIIGYGDLSLMEMSADDPHRKNINLMLEATHRAAALAKDLLLFSRKQFSDKKNVDLNEIVRAVEKFLLRVIGEDIDCSIMLGDEKMPVFADVHQLEQVLMNLASNARDAMPNGGPLSIATELVQLDEPFIAAQGYGNGGTYAMLTIQDAGIGMDDETRRQIFDPFFTSKEIGKGTGLGLAVVHGIVKQHDGYITVSSEPGLGATFRIYLPVVLSSEDDVKASSKPGKPVGGTETILLAEDDETVRSMNQKLLQNFGYEVIVAVDGEDAVQKFRENRGRIRLLLFDVIMPKKSGRDAYNEIRKIEPDIKIIFASGYAPFSVAREVLPDGNAVLLPKPYVPSNLLETIRNMLGKGPAPAKQPD